MLTFAALAVVKLLPANATWNWTVCQGRARPRSPPDFAGRRRFQEGPHWRVPGASVGEAPIIVHKLSDMQADALKAALRDLGDARKLLDPTSRI